MQLFNYLSSWQAQAQQASGLMPAWTANWTAGMAALMSARMVLAQLTRQVSTEAQKAHRQAGTATRSFLALGLWLLSPLANFFLVPLAFLALFAFPAWRMYAAVYLATMAFLVALPLDLRPPTWVLEALRWVMATGMRYFPASLHFVDKDAFVEGQNYLFAFEPHSIMPFGMMLFSKSTTARLPPALSACRILVSTAMFSVPFNRHLWHWMGCRPASRQVMRTLLSKGTSVVLCPGGVREVIYMHPGSEHAFLRSRRGFVRMAMEHGTPLVPVFAFGQSAQFGYLRLGVDWPYLVPRAWAERLSRALGFLPLLLWGACGTLMPRKVPMHVVVGRPIAVPQNASPPSELVEEYLQRFILDLHNLFEQHKAAAGHPHESLTIW